MKEIIFSFQVKISLKRRDVHWIEGELLKIREEVFLEILLWPEDLKREG